MYSDHLAIPLKTRPARQNFWRAVGIASLILGSILVGSIIERAWYFRSQTRIWPETAQIELKIVKTPKNSTNIATNLNGLQVLPGTPWSLNEALGWSKRELFIYANADRVVGLEVDEPLPQGLKQAVMNAGGQIFEGKHYTLIALEPAETSFTKRRLLNFWLIFPIFDGMIGIKNDLNELSYLPWRWSSDQSLDVLVPVSRNEDFAKRVSLPTEVNVLARVNFSPESAKRLLPAYIPLNFPGLSQLNQALRENGANLLIGEDSQGLVLTLAASPLEFGLETLGLIAQEGLGMRSLSTLELTDDDLGLATEIRPDRKISLNLIQTESLSSAQAETEDGQIFRLSQSSDQLIVSNRPPLVGPELSKISNNCLNNPQGLIRPRQLTEHLSISINDLRSADLLGYLSRIETLAWRRHLARICW